MPFQLGVSGGFSRSRGGQKRMRTAFQRGGVLKPPAGTYDPGLDASVRAAGRGFNDLRQDLDRDGQRASTSYTLGLGRLGEDEKFEAGGLDIAQQRLGEDYTRATSDLARNFAILGNNQAQASRAAGVTSAGLAVQAQKKRAENQGLEQQGIDLSRDRGLADIERSRGRMATMFGRAREDAGTDFQYGQDDRATGLARGGRENTFYGQDVADQRYFQAAQSGWRPPAAPKKRRGKK